MTTDSSNPTTTANTLNHVSFPSPSPCPTCHRCPTCGSYGWPTYRPTWTYQVAAAPTVPLSQTSWVGVGGLASSAPAQSFDASKLQATMYATNAAPDCPSDEACAHD